MWSASGCVATTTSIDLSHHGNIFPSSRKTLLSGPPSTKTCRPDGTSMKMASPCPILRNETVRMPCRSSRKMAYQMPRVTRKRKRTTRPCICTLGRIASFYLHELLCYNLRMYEAKKFDLPSLEGISDESVKQHIGLYEGYVKNFNAMSKQIAELAMEDWEKHAHPVAELIRRRSFEFDGMRLHEHYFEQFEGGAKELSAGSALAKALEKTYKPKSVVEVMTKIGNMRGPGWAILYYDKKADELLSGFSGEQHQGHFVTLPIILA